MKANTASESKGLSKAFGAQHKASAEEEQPRVISHTRTKKSKAEQLADNEAAAAETANATAAPTVHIATDKGPIAAPAPKPLVWKCSCVVGAVQAEPDECVLCGKRPDAPNLSRRCSFTNVNGGAS